MRLRVAIVAALAREIRPLVRGWKLESSANGVTVYSSEKAVVAFAGMGASRAGLAAEAALDLGPTQRILSVGWAGGLHSGIGVGTVWRIRTVFDSSTGETFELEPSEDSSESTAVLASTSCVASIAEKLRLRRMYSADLVDMEAAAVARVARQRGIRFAAIKAVSDEYDFQLPVPDGFITRDGQFREGAFAAYVALRPGLWRPVMRTARGSARAAENLCEALRGYLVTDENRAKA